MIFRPELTEKVLSGEKTETRRPVKEGETECRYVAGRDYAVQTGRRRRSIGRIAVTDTRKEKLGEITHEAAVREGFGGAGSSWPTGGVCTVASIRSGKCG
jgi:hypothetical protein